MKALFTNRLIVGMLAFFAAVGVWEFGFKAQYRPHYREGVRHYQQRDYRRALTSFERAYHIAPNAVEVILMMGWTTLRLQRFDEADYYFGRALRITPMSEEARRGARLAEEQRPESSQPEAPSTSQ